MDQEKPVIYQAQKTSLEELRTQYPGVVIIDRFDELVEDLFLIRNPKYKFEKDHSADFEKYKTEYAPKGMEKAGNWVYFPWSNTLVKYLPDAEHQELRTARNKNIIKAEEQKKFYELVVGIAGLSVGSHAALTTVMMGGARRIRLADPDTISGSNFNRIREDFTVAGQPKIYLASRKIYQMNPYAEVDIFPEGVKEANIDKFLVGSRKLDILVEETDFLPMKIMLRLKAREFGIPVVMATDNGDNVIVEVERYDLDKKQMLFNGAIGEMTMEDFQKMKPEDLPKLATKIAGPEYIVTRMQESLLEVGRSLYSWPQLGDAATLSGVVVAYILRRMAIGEKVRSGKNEVNLDAIFLEGYDSEEQTNFRETKLKEFLNTIGLN